MTVKLTADIELCKGYAACIIESPSAFDIDEDTGKVVILEGSPSEQMTDQVLAAARACPARAISVERS